jgi:hypothetical protein
VWCGASQVQVVTNTTNMLVTVYDDQVDSAKVQQPVVVTTKSSFVLLCLVSITKRFDNSPPCLGDTKKD